MALPIFLAELLKLLAPKHLVADVLRRAPELERHERDGGEYSHKHQHSSALGPIAWGQALL
jgi:hypothetical protein